MASIGGGLVGFSVSVVAASMEVSTGADSALVRAFFAGGLPVAMKCHR